MTLPAALGVLDAARELRGFQTEPAQMRAAAPGKVGRLRLGFAMRNGRSVLHDLYRVAPLLVQQALYWDEAMPELPVCPIISVGGGILQGDRYTIDITVEEGACAYLHAGRQPHPLHGRELRLAASDGDRRGRRDRKSVV